MIEIICPVCGENLTESGRSYICPKGHCFDKAKEGYVNLLTSSHKPGSAIGDNKDMAMRMLKSKLLELKIEEQMKKLAEIRGDVKEIPRGAFNGCANLKTVYIESSTSIKINDYAFQSCNNLKNVIIT